MNKHMRYFCLPFLLCALAPRVHAEKTLIDVSHSPHAMMQNVGLDEVKITGGFWKDRQTVNREVSLDPPEPTRHGHDATLIMIWITTSVRPA